MKPFTAWLLRVLAVSLMSTALWLAGGSSVPTLHSDSLGATTLLDIAPVRDLLVGALADKLAARTGTNTEQIRTALNQLDDQELQALLEPLVPAYLRGSGSAESPTRVDIPGLGTVLTGAATGTTAEPGTITLNAVEFPYDLQTRLDRILGMFAALRDHIVELMILAGLCALAAVALSKDKLRALRRVGRGWFLTASMVIAVGSFARYAVPDTSGIGVSLLSTLLRDLRTPTSAYVVAGLGAGLGVLSKAFEYTKSIRLRQRVTRRQATDETTAQLPR